MRLAGPITDWNDDKGFGFVTPNGGGERAFVHISEFGRGSQRPVAGEIISYKLAKDSRGRYQAVKIKPVGRAAHTRRTRLRVPRAAMGLAALAIVIGAAVAGFIPLLVAGAYGIFSVLSYVMYLFDKGAATRHGQRTPENCLHLADLLGGWPGALVAQQQFRHKTIKQPFKSVFWITVILNLISAWWLVTSGAALQLTRWLGV